MRRIIDDNSEGGVRYAFHLPIVPNDHRLELRVYVHGHDGSGGTLPHPAPVVGCVQDRLWRDGRIEAQHLFQKLAIAPLPHAADRRVLRSALGAPPGCSRVPGLEKSSLKSVSHVRIPLGKPLSAISSRCRRRLPTAPTAKVAMMSILSASRTLRRPANSWTWRSRRFGERLWKVPLPWHDHMGECRKLSRPACRRLQVAYRAELDESIRRAETPFDNTSPRRFSTQLYATLRTPPISLISCVRASPKEQGGMGVRSELIPDDLRRWLKHTGRTPLA